MIFIKICFQEIHVWLYMNVTKTGVVFQIRHHALLVVFWTVKRLLILKLLSRDHNYFQAKKQKLIKKGIRKSLNLSIEAIH